MQRQPTQTKRGPGRRHKPGPGRQDQPTGFPGAKLARKALARRVGL